MGCDIHLFTERKRSINNQPTWVNIDNWQINPYYEVRNDDSENKYELKELFGGRNYELFSILADVRNYSSQKFISAPRGLPDDVSGIVRREFEKWEGDGHSHSWFTLRELKDFLSENPKHENAGLVSVEQAKWLDEKGEEPSIWCLGSSDKTMVHRTWKVDSALKGLVDAFENKKKAELRDYEINDDTDDNLRIVFWFDN